MVNSVNRQAVQSYGDAAWRKMTEYRRTIAYDNTDKHLRFPIRHQGYILWKVQPMPSEMASPCHGVRLSHKVNTSGSGGEVRLHR